MKFEIAFVSLSGNTEDLAHGIADNLPHDKTFVTDLSHEDITGKADVYLIGFGVNKGTVPLKIMEVLDELHGKTILFFITAGMEPTHEYRDAVERQILPFMPDDCDYKGMFMCHGKFPEQVLQAANNKLYEEPDNRFAKRILQEAELSNGHPNQTDYENASRFVREQLGL